MIRYYVPEGVEAPTHILYPGFLHDTVGPEGGGGRIYGGEWSPEDTGWTKTAAGWWINPGNATPAALARLETHPRIVRWEPVVGVAPEHIWRVPVLVQPQREEPVDLFVSALDRVLTTAGFDAPADLADLQRELLNMALGAAQRQSFDAEEEALIDLTARILALGHHISRHELALGWLSELMMLRVLFAAIGCKHLVREAGDG